MDDEILDSDSQFVSVECRLCGKYVREDKARFGSAVSTGEGQARVIRICPRCWRDVLTMAKYDMEVALKPPK